jgi:hypothetical protein
MMTDYSRLEGWTPIAFKPQPSPALEWADMRGHRFDKAFFHRTVKEWQSHGAAPTEMTDLAALNSLDLTPSLDPSLIIAHSTRCGSTLLTRMMAATGGTICVSEPPLLGKLLSHAMSSPGDSPVDEIVLRKAVRAFGRVRFGDERRYVLKLGSMLTRFLPQFRRAFPRVPIVWLQRNPSEVVESNLTRPGGWAKLEPDARLDLAHIVLQKLTVVFIAAKLHVDDSMLVLDYRDLPDAAWTKVAPFIGMTPTKDDVARMREVVRFHAHDGTPFQLRERRQLPDWVEAVTRQTLDPLYQALDRRRVRVAA